MKKIISLVLIAVMLLSLCACGSSAAETTPATEPAASFSVGYGKADITPSKYGVPMDGYGNTDDRLSSGILSYVYAIAVAVTDAEGNTAIMMAVDSCSTPGSIVTPIRQWAQDTYGIPMSNILISCIHQHSCPDATSGVYTNEYTNGLKKAITAALEDRAPAEMYINTATTEAMSFIRHLWLNDGGYVTSHSCTGDKASGYAGYASESDKEMRFIKFTRQDAADIIMVNFQGHPHMGSGSKDTNIHSDWPGAMRDAVEKDMGALCIYFSGAGGNMNSSSSIKEDNITASKDFKQHGQRAAEYVKNAESGYTKVNTGSVLCKEITVTYPADHSLDHLLTQATTVNNEKKSNGIDAAKELLKQYPELNSHFQASAIVNKAARGQTCDASISVITFGDVAFTVHPYEMFDSNGKALREGTVGNSDYDADDQLENPFAMTFITTISNGSLGYIPSQLGYTNGGYERDTTRFAAGTGEQMVGDYLRLLNELHN